MFREISETNIAIYTGHCLKPTYVNWKREGETGAREVLHYYLDLAFRGEPA